MDQAASITVAGVLATNELLGEILTQLKIQNAQLALVTDAELGEADIPAEVA